MVTLFRTGLIGMTQFQKSLLWFRRDLRVFDHAALHHALRQSQCVACVFIFDTDILRHLPPVDRRVDFIHASVLALAAALAQMGGQLIVLHASAVAAIPDLARQLGVDAVLANHDDAPEAIRRDAAVAQALQAAGRQFLSFKDQVIFERDDILSLAHQPYSVFTPYKNAWLAKLDALGDAVCLPHYSPDGLMQRLAKSSPDFNSIVSLAALGFAPSNLADLALPCGMAGAQQLFDDFAPRMADYGANRDFPGRKGPSYLSVHLRFGTISIRALVRMALYGMRNGSGGDGAAVWLSELIWRDFYHMILYQHPHVVGHAFKPAYDAIVWEGGAQADALFDAWCAGRTGYPLVDAAMQQLNQSGYMHNRLRMVTASFLVKDLGIDWRWGEAYFARHLNDFDLAANNGGWQWAASTGCDAQPYFRIFNPVTQSEKFDADGKFIRRYLPQLASLSNRQIHAPWLADPLSLDLAGIRLGRDYPLPIVMHDEARQRTLTRYAVVKRHTAG
jgi:deoxyribodipyrimidine photo-lyase